ncbi:hypothetical protein Pmani_031739 [Petrolisthes manimaculis]|uniref:C2H2-type domain-containing protein n=1 Tax=Petrolisthes manimaculis TaxID=1843537 RepID=A0AAE1TS31_9EUCA|nr:hypothetical protein Pmani_031739 [Petrolisthes manimaculis]
MSRTTGASSSKPGGGAKLHQCDVCGKDFPFKVVLDMHKKDHAFKNIFKCSVCGLAYPKKSQLDMHFRKHTGERPFKCDECESSFMNSSNLQRHKRKHVCKRRYDIDEWEAAYTLSDNLSAEKRAKGDGTQQEVEGSGESPYVCGECGDTFTKMNTLLVHKRKHSSERPYSCDQCGAMFAVRASLDYHKLKHSGGEASYWQNVCDVCGDAFTSKDGLMQHQRKHNCTRPYNCDRYLDAFTTSATTATTSTEAVLTTPNLPSPSQLATPSPPQQQLSSHIQQQQPQMLGDHHQLQPVPEPQYLPQQQEGEETTHMTLQLTELQPPPQLQQLAAQRTQHLPLSSTLPHSTPVSFVSQGVQEPQVPGPMGPQAQPVQPSPRPDSHALSIKEEPHE